jgi:protein-S-isoprenylcysteine O-methyltransferase Ste14
MPSDDHRQFGPSLVLRAILALGIFLSFLAVTLFLPARINWMGGWLFLLVFLIEMMVAVAYLWWKNPEIFVARSKIHSGTKGWDKAILLFLVASFVAIFPAAGLDHRFHWSATSPGLTMAGYILFSIGMFGSIWVYGVNKFAEPGVRIQTDRGHTVIDSGPYAVVRHPLYVASIFVVAGIPFALGSLWALVPVGAGTLILVVRTVFEDRMLQNELPGYKEYAGRVRYRLIPGVW